MFAPRLVRIAAVLQLVVAIGSALSVIPSIRNLLAGQATPSAFGINAFMGGPFETLGAPAFISLLIAFAVFCILQAVGGVLLWGGRRSGAVLTLVLLPIGVIFWVGFALPLLPIFFIVATILVLFGWSTLR